MARTDRGSHEGASVISRIVAFAILGVAIVAVVTLLFSGDDGYDYRLQFETGGQLVPGNDVSIAGQAIGSVDSISLTDDAQAEVKITVDRPLHEGTTAMVRATSLSGIANRYVSIAPGPDNVPELPADGVIPADQTTSPVDLDELFDTFDNRTQRALQKVFQGQATIYAGNAKQARATYKYLAPGLQSTTRLLAELDRDQTAFSRFLISGSRALGAIALERDDLAALTENANEFLGAIANRNADLERTLVALPPAMRQANTTFVNLRAALDDLDPTVAAAIVGTRDLAPFLASLRPVINDSTPVFENLTVALSKQGPNNDLSDALKTTPGTEKAASKSVNPTLAALDDSAANVAFARAYSPDLIGAVSKLGQVTAFYDADGHYARVMPAAANLFSYGNGELTPITPAQQFDFYIDNRNTLNTIGPFERCPGGSTQPNPGFPNPADHPFLDAGALDGKCDVDDVPPGP